jgi:AraC-like DNA-binding protein
MAPRRFTSALVPFVLTLVRQAGQDASRLEKKYLRSSVPEVSLPELGALLADVSKELDDPLFGFHCAQAMTRGSYGLLEFGLRSAPTLRIAMEQLATYGALINPLVRWSTEPEGDELSLHHRAPQKGGVGRQGNVFTVTRMLQIAREMMGGELQPTRAWFSHAEKRCPPELAAYLGTKDLAFGRASNGLSFAAADLERRPVAADPELNRALELHGAAVLDQCADAGDVYEQTRRAVLELLPRGEASVARTAKRLHVTARTLQRRLLEEGVTFAALLTEVRRTQAERLLARSTAPLSQVAESVGYADAGAFVRAFRSWTGTTPGKFRELQS